MHQRGQMNSAPIFRPPSLDNFVLLEPRKVYADTFPKVFWCQESTCHRIYDCTASGELPNQKTCRSCQKRHAHSTSLD